MEQFLDYDYLKERINKASKNEARRFFLNKKKQTLGAMLEYASSFLASEHSEKTPMRQSKERIVDYSGKIARTNLFNKPKKAK